MRQDIPHVVPSVPLQHVRVPSCPHKHKFKICGHQLEKMKKLDCPICEPDQDILTLEQFRGFVTVITEEGEFGTRAMQLLLLDIKNNIVVSQEGAAN